jgi:hypothetical protein
MPTLLDAFLGDPTTTAVLSENIPSVGHGIGPESEQQTRTFPLENYGTPPNLLPLARRRHRQRSETRPKTPKPHSPSPRPGYGEIQLVQETPNQQKPKSPRWNTEEERLQTCLTRRLKACEYHKLKKTRVSLLSLPNIKSLPLMMRSVTTTAQSGVAEMRASLLPLLLDR